MIADGMKVGEKSPVGYSIPWHKKLQRRCFHHEAHKWAYWRHNPCHLGVPDISRWGTKSAVAHKWADRVHSLS